MTNAIATLTVPTAREAFEDLSSPHIFVGGGGPSAPSAAIETPWKLAKAAVAAGIPVAEFTPIARGDIPAPGPAEVQEFVQHLEGLIEKMSTSTYKHDAHLTQMIVINFYGDLVGIRGQMADLDPLTASLRRAVKHLLRAGRGYGIQVIITDPSRSIPYQETSAIFNSFGALVTLDDAGFIESIRRT